MKKIEDTSAQDGNSTCPSFIGSPPLGADLVEH